MATKSEINIEKKISDYFENASYDELYSNDIWFTIIVFLIVFCIALYFYIKSSLQAYRNSWQDNKCNPLLMPFASVINSDKVQDNNDLEYIVNNFNECLNTLTEEVATSSTKPINSILTYIGNFFNILFTIFIGIKGFIEYLLRLIMYFYSLVENSLKSVFLQISMFFMNINDFLGKIISMFLVVYYTLILVLRSWKLLVASLVMGWLLVIVNGVSTIMLICLITMIILLIMRILVLFIPFGFGYLISLGMIIPIIMFGGGFLVFLVLFCITLFIYGKFTEFLDRIMSY
jgi:hypothetical protein